MVRIKSRERESIKSHCSFLGGRSFWHPSSARELGKRVGPRHSPLKLHKIKRSSRVSYGWRKLKEVSDRIGESVAKVLDIQKTNLDHCPTDVRHVTM